MNNNRNSENIFEKIKEKQYKIKLKTITPIFIGNGDFYTNYEYLSFRNNPVKFITEKSLVSYFKNKGKLEELISKMETEDYLNKVIQKMGIDIRNQRELMNIAEKKLKLGFENSDIFLKGNIFKFNSSNKIKYIPGSSLKGSIRTCIINDEFLKNNENQIQELKNLNDNFKIEFSKEEKNFINYKVLRDCFNNGKNKEPNIKEKIYNILKGVNKNLINLIYKEIDKKENFDFSIFKKNVLNKKGDKLKGAIKNSFQIIEKRALNKIRKDTNKFINQNISESNKDKIKNIMKDIKISDSKKLLDDDYSIMKIHVMTGKKEPNLFEIGMAEFLNEGKETTFILNTNAEFNIEDMIKKVNYFSKKIIEKELNYFNKKKEKEKILNFVYDFYLKLKEKLENANKNILIIRIGSGSGLNGTTIRNSIREKYSETRNFELFREAVSRKLCYKKIFNDNRENVYSPFGWCQLEIVE